MGRIQVGMITNGGGGYLEPDAYAGPVLKNQAVDSEPLLMPKLDFSGRVNNGGCSCKPKPLTNGVVNDEPLLLPKLDFSHRR